MQNPKAYKKGEYLEPDFKVESSAFVASGVEEAKSDATIDAAAEKDGDSETFIGHRAREVRFEIDIEAL